MKFLTSQVLFFIHDRRAKRNLRSLAKFILVLVLFVAIYSILFHVIMMWEGKDYSWVTGVYWTLTVMSTLGFGDITFTSDLGRVFSIFVLMSGIVFLLVMLPFSFIQFFYAPFLEAQMKSRAPRELPETSADHIIIIGTGPMALSLASRLADFKYPYSILAPEANQALELVDRGYQAVVGEYDDPQTYQRLRAEKAAMIAVLSDDLKNTNISYTIREVAPDVIIAANADYEESVDILELAGVSHVYQFMRMLGEMLANRILITGSSSNVIGSFNNLHIAEASARSTPLVGQRIIDCGLRECTGMNIVAIWEKGRIEPPEPDTVIGPKTVLILAGTREQLDAYDEFSGKTQPLSAPVLILGGGRVGLAAAKTLDRLGIEYRIVEKNAKVVRQDKRFVHGNASDRDVLNEAGIREAPSVFVTTHNDDLNIYLTIYCRRLRPEVQIISRATMERNINVMHKAGADLVMSHSTLVANTVINLLSPGKVLTLTEGLNIFRVQVHPALVGKPLAESGIRQQTGCSVIAVARGEELDINPDPQKSLTSDESLLIIGDAEAERRYLEMFPG
jgi:Trk K+ transport system NAD-binding subunit